MSKSFPAIGVLARLRSGVSGSAEEVDRKLGDVFTSSQRSRALFGSKSDAISAVWAVATEAAEEDWNGEGALAVHGVAAANALVSFKRFPHLCNARSLAEPDGGISLDWIQSRTRIFSVSIGCNRCLPFAWLDGTSRGYGVVSFDGEDMPNRVLDEISKIRIDGTSSSGLNDVVADGEDIARFLTQRGQFSREIAKPAASCRVLKPAKLLFCVTEQSLQNGFGRLAGPLQVTGRYMVQRSSKLNRFGLQDLK